MMDSGIEISEELVNTQWRWLRKFGPNKPESWVVKSLAIHGEELCVGEVSHNDIVTLTGRFRVSEEHEWTDDGPEYFEVEHREVVTQEGVKGFVWWSELNYDPDCGFVSL